MAGFTLIEMLAVLAIIGILGSLFLSALSSTKSRAYQTVCRNNMRQMGLGFLLYVDSNGDTFPVAGHGGNLAHQEWVCFAPLVVDNGIDRALNFQNDSAISPYVVRLTTNMLRCPSNRILKRIEESADVRKSLALKFDLATFTSYPFSYTLNAGKIVSGLDGQDYNPDRVGDFPVNRGMASYFDGRNYVPYFHASIRNPVQKIMLAEEQTWDEFSDKSPLRYWDDNWSWDPFRPTIGGAYYHDPLTLRHNGRSQVVLADGHVETVRPAFADNPEHADPTR